MALGLGRVQVFRYIVWPQAFRVAIPPLMNSVVALTKDTALVAVISVPEVIREAQAIISVTFDPSKYYFIVAVMFFVITFPLMKLAGRLEMKIRKKGFAQ
jgi:glutamine transport system permease protein